jgi:hypothetical protein
MFSSLLWSTDSLSSWSSGYIAQTIKWVLTHPSHSLRVVILQEVLSPAIVERAHDLGMRMLVWTPNEASEIADSLHKGTDGNMFDRTEELLKTLTDHGKLAR